MKLDDYIKKEKRKENVIKWVVLCILITLVVSASEVLFFILLFCVFSWVLFRFKGSIFLFFEEIYREIENTPTAKTYYWLSILVIVSLCVFFVFALFYFAL